ncbi:MAG: aminopeptidase domain-containing protein [Parcubacteria group bacterium GW2011_GWA2_37_10]|nr:MAG: aminopeptidase domain-containing protein [Parcubacteria group bacterium GW2011_GWA2_37_10]
MMKLINDIWFKRRDIISDGFRESLKYISKIIPLKIHKIPTGAKCWTWIIPDKWTVKNAYIEDLDGNKLLDLKNHPLHIVSYSLPVDKIVSKEELFKHLHTSKERPNAIPFEFKYYQRDWGFCIQHSKLKEFTKDEYKVFIDSKFEKGNLEVGECIIKGKTDKTIVLVAHLCHPAQVNDDLTGVTVLVALAKEMQKTLRHPSARLRTRAQGKKNYYTYKFLFVPETIGSVAYLSKNEDIIPKFKYGVFLEMLGNDNIHALQLSRQGDTRIDRIARYVMERKLKNFREGPFRTIVANDEVAFNGPGVNIPMISISRYPYPEYHTSDDNPDIISEQRLEQSKNLILEILNIIDNDYTPKRRFKGPIFLSSYDLWVDWRENLKLNQNIEKIILNLEGDKTVFDIAEELNMEFDDVLDFINKLKKDKLIKKYEQ